MSCHIKISTSYLKILNFHSTVIVLCLLLFQNVKSLNALKCVCNVEECDAIKADDCPGKGFLVFDACRCCKVCAKALGEACGGLGGFSGTCEPGLKCILKPPVVGTIGICLDISSSTNITNSTKIQNSSLSCSETLEVPPGCEIVDRRCQCWRNPINVCRESRVTKWDFKNEEECDLNLQNLMKQELDFDEDFTLPPNSSKFKRKRKLKKSFLKSHQKSLKKHQISSTQHKKSKNITQVPQISR